MPAPVPRKKVTSPGQRHRDRHDVFFFDQELLRMILVNIDTVPIFGATCGTVYG